MTVTTEKFVIRLPFFSANVNGLYLLPNPRLLGISFRLGSVIVFLSTPLIWFYRDGNSRPWRFVYRRYDGDNDPSWWVGIAALLYVARFHDRVLAARSHGEYDYGNSGTLTHQIGHWWGSYRYDPGCGKCRGHVANGRAVLG